MNFLKVQELNVYVVVKNKDRVLVVKRKGGLWEFPGGGVDWGEDPENSAVREVKEETGLTIRKPLEFLGITSAVYEKEGNEKHSVYLVYSAETDSDQVILGEEHDEYRWLNRMEAGFLKYGFNAEPVMSMLD